MRFAFVSASRTGKPLLSTTACILALEEAGFTQASSK
jgi:hypothetical protein